MKFNYPDNNFTAGEWTPKMDKRTDVQEIVRSCKSLVNYIPQIHGGAQFRGGTPTISFSNADQAFLDSFIGGVLGAPLLSANGVRIIPYKNSVNIRKGLLFLAQNNNWKVIKASEDVGDMYSVTVESAAAHTDFWLPEDIHYVQLGDYIVMTNTLGLYPPVIFFWDNALNMYVVRDFTYQAFSVGKKVWEAQPWDKLNALDISPTLSVPAGTNSVGATFTLTASASLFVATDVGRYIRLGNGTAKDGVVKVTAYTSGTSVTVEIMQVLPNMSFVYGSSTNSNSFWLMSMWSSTTGYPKTVTVFEGRLIFGNIRTKQDTIWGSRISSYFDFMEIPYANTTGISGFASSAFTSDNSRPFTITPNTPESSAITALSAGKTLMIHTESAEIVAYGTNGALGPLNVQLSSSSTFGGSKRVQPKRINNFSTFVQRNGYKLRDITYSFNEDQYVSADLSFMAEHFFLNDDTTSIDEIVGLEKLEQRGSFMFTLTENGKLFCVTLDRDYKINAWTRITHADPLAHFISMASTVGLNNLNDPIEYMYALVRVTSSTGFHLKLVKLAAPWEYKNLEQPQYHDYITKLPQYLDCMLEAAPTDGYTPSPTIPPTNRWTAVSVTYALTGFPPPDSLYINQEVSVIADGNYIGEFMVDADGEFELPNEYHRVQIGLLYKGTIVPAAIEQGGQVGVPVGRQKRVDEMSIFFYKSMGTKFGLSIDSLMDIPMRDPNQPMGTPVKYFTGEKTVQFPQGYYVDYSVTIIQDKPYPSYIKCISTKGVTYD